MKVLLHPVATLQYRFGDNQNIKHAGYLRQVHDGPAQVGVAAGKARGMRASSDSTTWVRKAASPAYVPCNVNSTHALVPAIHLWTRPRVPQAALQSGAGCSSAKCTQYVVSCGTLLSMKERCCSARGAGG